ncbi:MAG: SDR family oxidoreductase [Bacteroidales bacterium]|nr:SDR family oxidoreductase [Bacteroidales bacterium]
MLKAKVILVTGGAGLLGRSFIEAILDNHGTAVIADVNQEAGLALKEELSKKYPGKRVAALPLDICSLESVGDLIRGTSSRYGRIDAVVNNAYPRNERYGAELEQVTLADFNQNVALHLGGYFQVMQQFSMFFRKQGFGNVVNIASVYGIIAPRFEIYRKAGFTMPVEYAAIKAAVIHLTRYFATYYKGSNIRFNCISPGGVFNDHNEEFREAYSRYALNKGMIEDSDLNGALVFLLSDGSSCINGYNLVVDDGFSL